LQDFDGGLFINQLRRATWPESDNWLAFALRFASGYGAAGSLAVLGEGDRAVAR